MATMTFAAGSALGALSVLLFTGCLSTAGSDVGTSWSAVVGSVTLDGFTTAGSVSAQNSANWSTFPYDTDYRVENNDWGVPQNGQGGSTIFTETLNGAQAFGWAWNVYDGTNVVIYPEVGYGWSPNGNSSWGGNPIIPQLSQQKSITANFNIIGQHSPNSTWDMAYDIWITSAAQPANTVGSFELMIWLDHNLGGPWSTQGPQGEVNIGGVNYQRYTNAGAADWTCLTYVNQGAGIYSGTNFDISDVIKDAAAKFGIPSSYYVASIEFGNEATNGSGMTEISNWAVNIGSAAPPPPTGGVYPLPGQVLASDYSALTGTMKLEPCSDVGGGEDVGYTSVGGTLQYQVSVAAAGSFNASYRVAALQGGSFDVLIDGNKVDTITVGNTGGWQSWTTVNGNSAYAIAAGTHTVQITVDSIAYNLNWLDFAASAGAPAPAANFSLDSWQYDQASGVTVWNGGVGNFVPGNWIEFNAQNLSTGYDNFAVSYTTTESGAFDVRLDSVSGTVIGTVSYGSTGGWNNYTWGGCSLDASLAQGTHNLYLVSTNGTANLGVLWIKNM